MRAERKRCGYTQAEAGAMAGVSGRTYQDWELRLGTINLAALLKLAENGFDVVYILTGRRIPSGAPSAEESALLTSYRAANLAVQLAARTLLAAAARESSEAQGEGSAE